MRTKRVADEKKMAERAAAGHSGTQSDVETSDNKSKTKPNAKGKAKAKANATAQA